MDLYRVLKDFNNAEDKRKTYSIGDVVEFKDTNKLDEALKRKLVEKIDIKVFETKAEDKTKETKEKIPKKTTKDVK
ncbi:hypothetical protein [Helcococcus kunzii]|uniref:hypothetical protein n=1 Tax=Helcococcus kunzii TaxID=40091 RepID=UPI0038AB70EB